VEGGGVRFRRYFPLLRVVAIIAAIGVWELLIEIGTLNEFTVSSPDAIAEQIWLWLENGVLVRAVENTLTILVLGYSIAIVIGVVLGIATGLSPGLRQYLTPFLIVGNALPRLVLVPFFVAWIGFGQAPKIIIVVLVILFLITFTVQTSIREVQGEYIENALMLGARRWDLITDVFAPAVLVWIVTSARLSIGLAFQAAVVSEFFGATEGLGVLIHHGQEIFAATEIYAAIAITMLLSWIIDFGLAMVDRRVSRWVPQHART
jgi:NitT/TauT family transport system permease protein